MMQSHTRHTSHEKKILHTLDLENDMYESYRKASRHIEPKLKYLK